MEIKTTGNIPGNNLRIAGGLKELTLWAILLWLILLILLPSPIRAHSAPEERIEHLSARITTEPANAELYLERAALYRSHRHWRAAQTDYERCRRLDPQLTRVDLGLGRLWLETGRLTQSVTALERYLETTADDATAWALLGRAHRESNEPEKASIAFDRAIDFSIRAGKNPPPEWYLARARSLLGSGPDYREKALHGLEQGLAVLGEPVTLHLEALQLERDLGRIEAALSRLDHLQRSANIDVTWLVLRAEILEGAGRPDDARIALERARFALATVPAGRRQTSAYRELEREIHDRLQRLEPAASRVGSTGD
ncbi:MAG: tetratricopeptide repeat protein [Acidobacteria bacterium]|nr:tetratricopeptide repeat protein [Acidobacteriota bacterium]